VAALRLTAAPLASQVSVQQDSTLDNLHHAARYVTARSGELGGVVRRGTGARDVILIPGWGFGAEVFDSFMRANATRYRMVAVTLPGFGGTAAPPMPPDGTSYADQSWTRPAAEAIARLIVTERLSRPVVVGHFVVGTQLALRLALDHPDLVSGAVIVGGEPVRFTPSRRDTTGRTPADMAERIRGVDLYLAPRWFKTVTKQTWDANNYAAVQYSRDAATAKALWRQSAAVPVPVMVRYLCEYLATDIEQEYASLRVPVTALLPDFTQEILRDPQQSYARSFFVDAWSAAPRLTDRITTRVVSGAHIFVMLDKPSAVRDAIDGIAVPKARSGVDGRR
jgi:pimeloyl-ACP methyl ester carboxylesterase